MTPPIIVLDVGNNLVKSGTFSGKKGKKKDLPFWQVFGVVL
jgi:hypothetical protein